MKTPDASQHHVIALGRRIAELRLQRTLTQEALAQCVDVTEKYLQFIESGRANPTLKVLLRISAALAVDPVEMFKPPESMEQPRPGRPPRKRIPS